MKIDTIKQKKNLIHILLNNSYITENQLKYFDDAFYYKNL